MSTDPARPISIAEIDGTLRTLNATLQHITADRARRDMELRIDSLLALRASLVEQETAQLARWWRGSWPGSEAPGWPQASGAAEGVGA